MRVCSCPAGSRCLAAAPGQPQMCKAVANVNALSKLSRKAATASNVQNGAVKKAR